MYLHNSFLNVSFFKGSLLKKRIAYFSFIQLFALHLEFSLRQKNTSKYELNALNGIWGNDSETAYGRNR